MPSEKTPPTARRPPSTTATDAVAAAQPFASAHSPSEKSKSPAASSSPSIFSRDRVPSVYGGFELITEPARTTASGRMRTVRSPPEISSSEFPVAVPPGLRKLNSPFSNTTSGAFACGREIRATASFAAKTAPFFASSVVACSPITVVPSLPKKNPTGHSPRATSTAGIRNEPSARNVAVSPTAAALKTRSPVSVWPSANACCVSAADAAYATDSAKTAVA